MVGIQAPAVFPGYRHTEKRATGIIYIDLYEKGTIQLASVELTHTRPDYIQCTVILASSMLLAY